MFYDSIMQQGMSHHVKWLLCRRLVILSKLQGTILLELLPNMLAGGMWWMKRCGESGVVDGGRLWRGESWREIKVVD